MYSHYKLLWVLGLLTAVLTAYYMTRLQVLAFGGEPRWDKIGPNGEPAHHAPHESPWVMRLPLVVLAAATFFGGVLDLPWVHHDSLAGWLAPVFAGSLYNDHLHDGGQWALALTDVAAAIIGLIIAVGLWRGAQVDKPQLEPEFLQRVWYWDDFYDAVIGRPSQKLATFCAWVVDARIIDGAVNGAAQLVRSTGSAHPQAADRVRAQLRPGHRRGHGRPHRLPPQPDVVVMGHSVPFLTLLILLPAVGSARAGPAGPRPPTPQAAGRCPGGRGLAGHPGHRRDRLRHHEGALRGVPAGLEPCVHR